MSWFFKNSHFAHKKLRSSRHSSENEFNNSSNQLIVKDMDDIAKHVHKKVKESVFSRTNSMPLLMRHNRFTNKEKNYQRFGNLNEEVGFLNTSSPKCEIQTQRRSSFGFYSSVKRVNKYCRTCSGHKNEVDTKPLVQSMNKLNDVVGSATSTPIRSSNRVPQVKSVDFEFNDEWIEDSLHVLEYEEDITSSLGCVIKTDVIPESAEKLNFVESNLTDLKDEIQKILDKLCELVM